MYTSPPTLVGVDWLDAVWIADWEVPGILPASGMSSYVVRLLPAWPETQETPQAISTADARGCTQIRRLVLGAQVNPPNRFGEPPIRLSGIDDRRRTRPRPSRLRFPTAAESARSIRIHRRASVVETTCSLR
jgi:hypothetical protein